MGCFFTVLITCIFYAALYRKEFCYRPVYFFLLSVPSVSHSSNHCQIQCHEAFPLLSISSWAGATYIGNVGEVPSPWLHPGPAPLLQALGGGG